MSAWMNNSLMFCFLLSNKRFEQAPNLAQWNKGWSTYVVSGDVYNWSAMGKLLSVYLVSTKN